MKTSIFPSPFHFTLRIFLMGAIWVRRGLESQSGNVGVLSTRKIGRLQI